MAHIHAALMRQYADDAAEHDQPWKLWEYKRAYDGKWLQTDDHPAWDVTTKYRRKQRTIRIGEFDVPEPMLVAPENGSRYYIFDLYEPFSFEYLWDSDETDFYSLEVGIAHSTERAARLHAIALISLTCTPERLEELKKMAAELEDKQ